MSSCDSIRSIDRSSSVSVQQKDTTICMSINISKGRQSHALLCVTIDSFTSVNRRLVLARTGCACTSTTHTSGSALCDPPPKNYNLHHVYGTTASTAQHERSSNRHFVGRTSGTQSRCFRGSTKNIDAKSTICSSSRAVDSVHGRRK